jgi:hypothetical protein
MSDNFDEPQIEEPFLKRPSITLWILAVGLLVLSIAFPFVGFLTPIIPLAILILMILYWMAVGVISLAWGLFLSAIVFLLTSPWLLFTGLRDETRRQYTKTGRA